MERVPRPGLAARAGAPSAGTQGQLPPRAAPREGIRADELGSARSVRVHDPRHRLGCGPLPGVPTQLEAAIGRSLRSGGAPGIQRPELVAAPDLADRALASGPARRLGGRLQHDPRPSRRRSDRAAPPDRADQAPRDPGHDPHPDGVRRLGGQPPPQHQAILRGARAARRRPARHRPRRLGAADLRWGLQRQAEGEQGLRPAGGALRPRTSDRAGPAQPPAGARPEGGRASGGAASQGARRGGPGYRPANPALRPQRRDWKVLGCGIVTAMATASRAKNNSSSRSEESTRAEQSVQAFREALEKSVTISRDRLQEVIDDAVRRGRMTHGDAEEIVSRLVTRGRDQADDLLRQVERLLAQVREAPGRARQQVKSRTERARKRAVKAADRPLAGADRVRRAARVPGFPITAYDQLSVRQIDRRLQGLSRAELRKVRDYERRNKARKSLLRSLDRKLQN